MELCLQNGTMSNWRALSHKESFLQSQNSPQNSFVQALHDFEFCFHRWFLNKFSSLTSGCCCWKCFYFDVYRPGSSAVVDTLHCFTPASLWLTHDLYSLVRLNNGPFPWMGKEEEHKIHGSFTSSIRKSMIPLACTLLAREHSSAAAADGGRRSVISLAGWLLLLMDF